MYIYVFQFGFCQEMQNLKKLEDAEIFMLLHGERIIDTLGEEVDRIEKSLKVGMYFLHL